MPVMFADLPMTQQNNSSRRSVGDALIVKFALGVAHFENITVVRNVDGGDAPIAAMNSALQAKACWPAIN